MKSVEICSFLRCAKIYDPENIGNENKKGVQMKGIKVDEKSYKNILIYYFEYLRFKDFRYAKINVNLWKQIFDANSYRWKQKDNLKKYKEQWCKIKDLIRSKNNNSNDYHKKYMKITFNLDDNLPVNKKLWLHSE